MIFITYFKVTIIIIGNYSYFYLCYLNAQNETIFDCFFSTFLLSLCISAVANAQIPMGAYTAEQTAYITAEDPTMTDGRNFKNLPVTMKKG
jgi:hypothetical protein